MTFTELGTLETCAGDGPLGFPVCARPREDSIQFDPLPLIAVVLDMSLTNYMPGVFRHVDLIVTQTPVNGDPGNGDPGNGNGDVPEPATMLLLGTGLVGCALRQRRKHSSATVA